MVGEIMTISRLRMGTDGEGVSTLITFFNCPLHCKYCANNFCHESDDSVPRTTYTPRELINVLKKDDIYYKMSGGGIVFGGGEPLLQSAFIHEICKHSDPVWKKRIETSMNVPWRNIEPILNDMDEWIIDIKDIDRTIYKNYTGVDNQKLINNLCKITKYVDKSQIHIRIPIIPEFNTESDVKKSVKWIKDILGVEPEIFKYAKIIDRL